MKKHQLKAYSWEEVSEMEREKQVVLVPLGSVEQEGTHLPLGVDTYVAEALADAVAKEAYEEAARIRDRIAGLKGDRLIPNKGDE